MSPQVVPAHDADDSVTKASAVLGCIAVLKRLDVLPEVVRRVGPETRALVENPPPVSAWVRSDLVDDLARAVYDLGGVGMVRTMMREGSQVHLVPLLQSFLGGLLRLFGATPHTVYSNLAKTAQLFNRGYLYDYERTGEKSCRVRVARPASRDIEVASFQAIAGGLEAGLGIVGAKGKVSDPVVVPNGRDNTADFSVEWT